jgi:hypothetical protein
MALRSVGFSAALVLGLASIGCSSDGESDPHDESPITGLDDVIFVGRATDEALAHLLDRTVEDSEAQRMVFDSPEASAVLSKDEPTAFTYRYAITGKLEHRRAPEVYTPLPFRERALRDLRNLFGPIRDAHAHGTPFNGFGYFLELTDAGGASVLRIFTDETTYTADSLVWSALADASQPLTLTLVTAIFEENKVPAGGGPFVGGSVEFSVE